jgi:hypothetical protein
VDVNWQELGCKVSVQAEYRSVNTNCSLICTKEALVVCLSISPTEQQNEKLQKPFSLYCCEKPVTVAMGSFAFYWHLDLKLGRESEKRGFWGRMKGLRQRCRHREMGDFEELKPLLLQ